MTYSNKQTEQAVFMCLGIYVTTIKEKRGHEFESKEEHGRDWKVERKGGNDLITL